jgi:lipooligosaccharide transport system ATP-binding protein
MNSIITARSLVKKYDGLTAVDSIDFEIIEGEVFGFLGPNGAGKTTTMKMIHCFIPPTSGELRVAGLDVVRHQRRIKAILGVVPQEDSLDPDLTVYGNLITYSRYHEIPKSAARERSDALLEMMSLTEKRGVIIENLSGGMKRRLLIARGLINDPRILILDEPTTGLDPQARHLVWSKLRELKDSGITIILTTHYMEEATRLCDRLVMMNNGKILDIGSPTELVKRHIGKEVLEVDYVDEELYRRIRGALGDSPAIEHYGDRVYITTDSAHETASRLQHLDLRVVSERKADLEDVFLKLTGRTLVD